MLDPLRVAPAHLRQDAAVSFLRDLLPAACRAGVGDGGRAGGRSRDRRARATPTCLEVVRALAQGDEVDRAGRQDARGVRPLGSDAARASPTRREPAGGRAPTGDLPADPRPARTGAGHGARGVLAGGARRRADRAADRDVRDAPDGHRARAPEAVLLRRGLAAAQRPRRSCAARFAAAHGSLRARRADHQHAARQRHADRRARVAREPARRDVRVRHALGRRGGTGAGAARSRSRGQAHAPEPARARRGSLPVSRPPRPASRRSRSMSSCLRCCAPSRRRRRALEPCRLARRSSPCRSPSLRHWPVRSSARSRTPTNRDGPPKRRAPTRLPNDHHARGRRGARRPTRL